ncbi:MAG: hypothetical protein CMF61_06405, partial [Magnetococcales bacterium]|nr:hypothetical protein [Magnetococcales bacterium]
MTGSLNIFIALMGLIFFYFFTGRSMANHTLFERVFASSGLFNIISAVGLWIFMVLVGVNWGMPLTAIWWFFVASAVIISLLRLFSRYEGLSGEHSLTFPIVGLIFLIPTLSFVWGDVPLNVDELVYQLPWLKTLDTSDVATLYNPSSSFAIGLMVYPLMLFMNNIETAFALLNVVLLVFVADGLLKMTDIQTKWSNLPLLAVVSLFSLTVLNPFFEVKNLTSFNENYILSVVIIAAMMPLCREKEFPHGFGVLPSSFILAMTACAFGEIGFFVTCIFIGLYVLRSLFDSKKWVDYLFGSMFVVCIPLLSYYLYAGLWGEFTQSNAFYISLSSLELLWLALTVIVFLTQVVFHKGSGFFNRFFVVESWVTMPAAFVVSLIGLCWFKGVDLPVTVLQFVVLIPIWYLVTSWYKNSKWSRLAYESPWVIALGVGVVFVSAQSLVSGQLTERFDDPSIHIQQIAKELPKEGVNAEDSIAVLEHDVNKGSLYYSALLSYTLNARKAPVVNVDEIFRKSVGDIRLFHMALMNNNFKYLWLHTPKESDKNWVGRFLNVDKSYLFKVTSTGLSLVQIYP